MQACGLVLSRRSSGASTGSCALIAPAQVVAVDASGNVRPSVS